ERGEIIVLLATNEMGKTTFLKVLGGQICLDGGKYEFEGHPFAPSDKAFIGYMNDTQTLPTTWKVKEAVTYYKQYFKTFNENKCYELLVYFKLDKQSQISNLSKGDNEKLQLALCLAIEASLYILDEPLVAVGLLTRIEIIKMILNNFDLKTTIIFSSHLVRDIDTILDRIWILKDGTIVEDVRIKDLRKQGNSVMSCYKGVFTNV
ncbi:MAG: ATP-binding cassette domain-containing protein, partial [Turicibacter sp.]|nr:ATP-binding cassette domain-containing protein [Turicibacter sp.]